MAGDASNPLYVEHTLDGDAAPLGNGLGGQAADEFGKSSVSTGNLLRFFKRSVHAARKSTAFQTWQVGESETFAASRRGKGHNYAMNLVSRGERIRFVREKILKLPTHRALAKVIGVSHAAIGQWERDANNVSRDNLLKMSQLSGVSIEWIETGVGPVPAEIADGDGFTLTEPVADQIEKVDRKLPGKNTPNRGIKELDSSAGLGGGQAVPTTYKEGREVDAFKSEPWIFPRRFMASLLVPEEKIIAITTQGESMSPTINHGDVVFIDTMHVRVSPPGLYAMRDLYGEVIIKRLDVFRKGDAIMIRITSDNPHEPSRDEPISEVSVVGRVCGILKRV